MASKPLPKHAQERTRELLAQGLSKTEVAKRLGIDRGSVRRYAGDGPPEPTPRPTLEREYVEEGDSASCSVVVPRIVKTEKDAMRVAEVDTSVWYVDRWECTQWTVPLKLDQGEDEKGRKRAQKVEQQQQYRVSLKLKRLMPRPYLEALDAIFSRVQRHAPKYPKPALVRRKGEGYLAVFGLFDVHFGKLAWAPETGENYDLRIAETVYRNAVEDLLAEVDHRNISRIVLPVGNDFFHMDNSRNTTLAGTPQDVDGRYAKVIEAGEMAVIWAVELLQARAPVEVIWVPGNHDATTSFHLARTVKAWFHRCPRVVVDAGPSPRKYLRWGANLLGFTHGDQEKHEALPNLMANERPQEWAEARCREWLIGHQHQSKKYTTKPVETRDATVVRVLRSLAGTDAWHHRKGYISTSHAAEVYLYGEERGYAGHAIAPARYEERMAA